MASAEPPAATMESTAHCEAIASVLPAAAHIELAQWPAAITATSSWLPFDIMASLTAALVVPASPPL